MGRSYTNYIITNFLYSTLKKILETAAIDLLFVYEYLNVCLSVCKGFCVYE